MKRLEIFASQKGGAGKTTTAKAMLDLSRRAGRTVSAWDLDSSTSSFAMAYQERDPAAGVGLDNVRSPKSKTPWLNALYTEVDDVIVDVPGGALDDLIGVLGRAGAIAGMATDAGREVVLVTPIGVEVDAVLSAQDAVERFGSAVHHVVVKNGYFGDDDEFFVFDGLADPETGQRLFGNTGDMVREAGGEVVYLPKLDSRTMALVKLKGLSFVEGVARADILGRRDCWRLRDWLEQVAAAFEGTWLSPSGSVPPARKDRRPRVAAAN